MKDKLSHVETEKKRLTQDNSSLYEKIRYLQNYSQTSKPGQRYSGHIDSMEAGHSQLQKSMDLSSLEFSNVYEQKLSPVAMFSQLERQKKLKELTVIERVLLNSTVQSKLRVCDSCSAAGLNLHGRALDRSDIFLNLFVGFLYSLLDVISQSCRRKRAAQP